MDLFAFIQVTDPTKVKVVERKCAEGEAKLLDSSVRCVFSLLLVAPAHAKSELEASMDRLFGKGGSMEQEDSAADGGHDADIKLVTAAEDVATITTERPRRQRKKRPVVTDASGSSYHPKKLRGDYETSSGAAIDDSSHHSSVHASGAKVDSIIRSVGLPPVMTKAMVISHAVNAPSVQVPETGTKITSSIHASMFRDSESIETVKADDVGPSYSTKQDLSMGSRELNAETLHQICEMDYHHLFTEFNVGTARQACLNAEVSTTEAAKKVHASEMDALKQKNVVLENEMDSLNGKIIELQSSVSAKDLELKDVNVVAYFLKSQNDGLVDK
nr:hypothetical protein [Tanacetum cinerariifolium]